MRFTWDDARLPELGDVAVWTSGPGANDQAVARRAYRVAGILEGRDRHHFRLVMERIGWDEAVADPAPSWAFYDNPRGK